MSARYITLLVKEDVREYISVTSHSFTDSNPVTVDAAVFSLFVSHLHFDGVKGVPEGSLTFKCAKRNQHLPAPHFTLTTVQSLLRKETMFLYISVEVCRINKDKFQPVLF